MSLSDGVLRWIGHYWIALLAYLFVGGAIAQGLGFAEVIGPYCADTVRDQEIYPACVPCGLNWGVFGVIELTSCGNPVLDALISYGVIWPHTVVVILAVLAYPLAGALRSVEPWLAGAILLPIVSAIWIRTIFFNFFQKRDVRRGLHRALLAGCILLATLMATSI